MSGVVNFSDGSSWSVGRRGWNILVERTHQKLVGAGLDHLCNEIADYGVFFNLDSDEVRVPLAQALYDSSVELQVECAEAEGWDTATQGPYFGDLVEKLERELMRT